MPTKRTRVDSEGWTERRTKTQDMETHALQTRSVTTTSNRLLVLGFVVACGLCLALLAGLGVQMKTTRRFNLVQENQACDKLRDTICSWAYVLSARANSIGTAITGQEDGLPFLVPGEKVSAGVESDIQFVDDLHHGNAHSAPNPSIVWHAAVDHADRELYETLMSEKYGFNVSINDVGYRGGQGVEWMPMLEPAPQRPTYYPLSAIWGPIVTPMLLRMAIGRDTVPNALNALPEALTSRTFDELKIAAHCPFDPSGKPIVNDGLILSIPYCGSRGCDDANATISGIVLEAIVAEDWGALFPDHVEITAFGHKVKSVDASRYSAHADAHESYLDLDIRCWYHQRSMWQTVGSFLMYKERAASLCHHTHTPT